MIFFRLFSGTIKNSKEHVKHQCQYASKAPIEAMEKDVRVLRELSAPDETIRVTLKLSMMSILMPKVWLFSKDFT